ncbi:MAG: hypothetical protein NTX25_12240 [Proteobacteria bacterium]|nr:hypothetical protein [Pseudomonadota bacterium]
MVKKKKLTKKTKLLTPRPVLEQEEGFSTEMLDPENVRERISITFKQSLLDKIREVAAARDIGYQVLIQQVLGGLFLNREIPDFGEKMNARIKIQKMQDDLELIKQTIGKKAQ